MKRRGLAANENNKSTSTNQLQVQTRSRSNNSSTNLKATTVRTRTNNNAANTGNGKNVASGKENQRVDADLEDKENEIPNGNVATVAKGKTGQRGRPAKAKQPLQKLGLKNQKSQNEEQKNSLNGEQTTAAVPMKKEPLDSTAGGDGNILVKPEPPQTRKRTRSCSARKAAVPPSKRPVTVSDGSGQSKPSEVAAENAMKSAAAVFIKEEEPSTTVSLQKQPARRSLRLKGSDQSSVPISTREAKSSKDQTSVKSEVPEPINSNEQKSKASVSSNEQLEAKTEVKPEPVAATTEKKVEIRRIVLPEGAELPGGRLLRARNFQDYLDEVSSMSSQSSLISSSVNSDSTFSPGLSSRNSPALSTSSSDISLSEPVIFKYLQDNGVNFPKEEPSKTNASNVTQDVKSLSLKSLASTDDGDENENDDTIVLRSGGDFGKSSRTSDFKKTIVISTKSELLPVPRETLCLNYDRNNILEPNMNPAYMQNIFCYLKAREEKFKPIDYIPKQPYITTKMRSILYDWFIEVQESLALNHEILYHAIKLCDLYLCKKQILKRNYQLLGATCLFIATKYDDRLPPPMTDFLEICGSAGYFESEMIRLEQDILRRLRFDIGFPLSYRFLRRYSTVQNNNFTTLCQARFFLECSVLEYSFCTVRESLLAAACLMLAHITLKTGYWCEDVQYASGYKRKDLTEVMRLLNDNTRVLVNLYNTNKKKFNIVRKYTSPLFKNVASNPLVESSTIDY